MDGFFKKHFVVVVAFLLPVLLMVITVLYTYLPSLRISTDYNFVYASCMDSDGNLYRSNCVDYLQKRYSVVNGQLLVSDVESTKNQDDDGSPDENEKFVSRLFLHDTKSNETREITQVEAQSLKLSELITSPDGVSVIRQYDDNNSSADFLFFSFEDSSNLGYYLMKGGAKSKLSVINDEDRYYFKGNLYFIGWVLPGRN